MATSGHYLNICVMMSNYLPTSDICLNFTELSGVINVVYKEPIERAISHILSNGIGVSNVNDEVLSNTPDRVARAYAELFSGYGADVSKILGRVFDDHNDEMVIVKDIPMYSMCEHHMLPFIGVVHIGYIPDGKILGISKFARLVEVFARRLQLQERLTAQVADAIMEHVMPQGVAIVIRAEHTCMTMRGINKPGTQTVTSAMRGIFKEDAKTRAEFLGLIKGE